MNTTTKTNAAAKKTNSKTDQMRAAREAKAVTPTEPAPAESAPAPEPSGAKLLDARAKGTAAKTPAKPAAVPTAAAKKAMPASLAKAREALDKKREADRAANAGKSGVFIQTRTAVTKLSTRVEALSRRLARWHLVVDGADVFQPIADSLKTASEALKGSSTGFAAVPDTWKPPMGGARSASLKAGDTVAIRQTVRASYEDVLEAEEMEGLKVEQVGAKGKIVCRTAAGDRVVFPANHLAHIPA